MNAGRPLVALADRRHFCRCAGGAPWVLDVKNQSAGGFWTKIPPALHSRLCGRKNRTKPPKSKFYMMLCAFYLLRVRDTIFDVFNVPEHTFLVGYWTIELVKTDFYMCVIQNKIPAFKNLLYCDSCY